MTVWICCAKIKTRIKILLFTYLKKVKPMSIKFFTPKFIYPILTLLWVILIFSFSLQSGDTSAQMSSGFGKWLIQTLLPFAKDFLEEHWGMVHLLIRKGAHFTEFLVLGVLVRSTLQQYAYRLPAHLGAVAWLMCVVVASCDETIQRFVGGRAGQVQDVLLDSCGALVGVAMISLLIYRRKKW